MKPKLNAYETTLYEFIDNVYVVCPNCGGRGNVGVRGDPEEIRLACPKCGSTKYHSETAENGETAGLTLGTDTDPYFRLPLWLRTEMPDGVLWAYNYEHLELLEAHIGSAIRDRKNSPMRNKSIGSRLPKWLTSKKNRDDLMNAIRKLKRK